MLVLKTEKHMMTGGVWLVDLDSSKMYGSSNEYNGPKAKQSNLKANSLFGSTCIANEGSGRVQRLLHFTDHGTSALSAVLASKLSVR